MENLWENIKEKLESEAPTHKPDLIMWDNIEAALPKSRRKYLNSIAYFIAGALAFFTMNYLHVKTTSTPTNREMINAISTDTIYVTKERKITDTVWVTRYSEKSKVNFDASFFSAYEKELRENWTEYRDILDTKNTLTAKTDFLTQQLNRFITPVSSNSSTDLANKILTTSNQNDMLFRESTVPLEFLGARAIQPLLSDYITRYKAPSLVIDLSKKHSLFEHLKPKSLSAYLSGGFAQQVANQYSALSGTEFGIGITSIMTNHWRYNLNMNISKLNGEFENDDSLPNIQSPDTPTGYRLEEVYLYQNNLGGSFGIDYLFNPYRFIRPYAGIYYQYRSSNFRGSVFKFESDSSEEIEIAVPNITQFSVNEIGLRGGLDFNLWNSIDAFIGIHYRHNFSTIENKYFSVNAGMYYHF